MTDDIEALADKIAETHVAYFATNPKGEVQQSCLIFDQHGEGHIIVCGWNSAEERDATIGALRMFIEAAGATRYAIWAETWMVRPPKETEQAFVKAYRQGALAEHPNRVEAVFTLVVDASGIKASRMQEIVRDRRGRVEALKPVPNEYEIGGELANLMPQRSVH